MSINNQIIIWGVDDYNVLGLFRALGGRHLKLFFLIFQGVRNCASSSKYCTDFYSSHSIQDGYEFLLKTFTSENSKPILIISNDLIAEFVDIHQIELEKYFIIPKTGKPGTLKYYTNKSNMTNLASKLGFIVPKSMYCTWNSDFSNFSDFSFPCLLKPNHQTEGKYNEFKFKVCKNQNQLHNTLKFVRKESSFILQEYIPKESVDLVYGCRLLSGEVLLAGILHKDRFCDNGDGSHGILSSNYPSYIDPELIKKIILDVDFYGLFSVEFGIYNGKAYFFEVNWRNDGTSHLFYQAGANLPLAWIMSAVNQNVSSISTQVTSTSYFIDELFDKQNIHRGVLSKKQYENDFNQSTVFKYYNPDDELPYRIIKRQRLKKLMLDSIVSRYRLFIVYLFDKLGIKR